jgi:hypothetical protein
VPTSAPASRRWDVEDEGEAGEDVSKGLKKQRWPPQSSPALYFVNGQRQEVQNAPPQSPLAQGPSTGTGGVFIITRRRRGIEEARRGED